MALFSRHRISLRAKLLGLVIPTMLITISLLAWVNLRTQGAMLGHMARQHSHLIAESVHAQVSDLMRSGQHAGVDRYLADIQRQHSLNRVMIFDSHGKIMRSSDPAAVGTHLSQSEIDHLLNHIGKRPHEQPEPNRFSSIVAIPNEISCHSCHAPNQTLLGYIDVDFSLDQLEALRVEGRQTTFFTSLAMLLVAIVAISLFFFYYVENPLRKLMAAMGRLEEGDFEHARPELKNSSELWLFSQKFGAMGTRLHGLIQTKIDQEKALVKQQQQLAHSDELHRMNLTLEDRLKEIEYLNVTLEERIEEIEEANFKIADLAAELESKNVSLQQSVERLSALCTMGLAINSTMDLSRLFDLLLRKSSDTLQAEVAYLLLLNPERTSLRVGRVAGNLPQPPAELSIPLRKGGISNWVIESGEALLVADIQEASEFNRESLLGYQRRSVLCAPLSIKGEVIGTLTIANRRDGGLYTQDDLELVSSIASQASIAISNARLYEEQEKTYLATVQALVSAIEASDAYTRGHSERVTRITLAIAQQMGLDGQALTYLEQAAILHDVGKIGIDPALLHKETVLSGKERIILQQHPLIGCNILAPISFLAPVRTIIAQHHERVDGEGYPHGLRRDAILLEARILAVADTYDAITSHRPYRSALSHQHAVDEIRAHSGTQFDPEVVAAFLECCEREYFAA